MSARMVQLGGIIFANDRPFVLLGGVNVLEDLDFALRCAGHYKQVCQCLGIPLVFKASYDKANRSSIHSFRGPGLQEGLRILQAVKDTHGIPVITDVHSPEEAISAAKVADIIQLPAFLARQTDLVCAMAETGAVINIKKPQFLSPEQLRNIVEKFRECGNEQLLICERGTSRLRHPGGRHARLGVMKRSCDELPLIFDVTHALQCRDPVVLLPAVVAPRWWIWQSPAWLLVWRVFSWKPTWNRSRPAAMGRAPCPLINSSRS